MERIKRSWISKKKGATEMLNALNKLEKKHARLLLKAEKGNDEAYKEANLLLIKIRSLEDRLQGKANKVTDLYMA